MFVLLFSSGDFVSSFVLHLLLIRHGSDCMPFFFGRRLLDLSRCICFSFATVRTVRLSFLVGCLLTLCVSTGFALVAFFVFVTLFDVFVFASFVCFVSGLRILLKVVCQMKETTSRREGWKCGKPWTDLRLLPRWGTYQRLVSVSASICLQPAAVMLSFSTNSDCTNLSHRPFLSFLIALKSNEDSTASQRRF